MCDAACSGNPCPIGTTYEETCKSIGWFSSWWFWRYVKPKPPHRLRTRTHTVKLTPPPTLRWGGYEHEDWCALPSSSIPSSAIDVTRTNVLYGSIPASCLAFDCTGDVFSAASCNTLGSGWNEESVTTECGREAGFGTTASRPCVASKGSYEIRTCTQTEGNKGFILSSSNIENRNECWPEMGYASNKFATCQAQFNGYDYYAAYYMNSDKDCVQLQDHPRVVQRRPQPCRRRSQDAGQRSSPNMKTQSIGAGASLAVAPAAVIGLFFMKKKMKKKQKEETPLVGNENL
ncbi:hypothetical protein TL16_g00344 [Triparma laevis f. inornata]|uniref:Uncharacterized protein n=1 Tax=Triparma laevis f. inornata TaxID=1714386 RepID=A0A9W7DM35_9STRA|nr:hypothetical protein TL16_g00344 [Triparma laevis f. inornata]